jgi:predicted SAM-dependent methyltransferase
MRALNIGGRERNAEGWETFDINPGDGVDHVGDARNPGATVKGPFDIVYSSHCFEHLEYGLEVLKNWRAITAPGGELYLSVPDMKVIGGLLARPGNLPSTDLTLLAIIYGGHVDEHDVHVTGYTWNVLEDLLAQAGWRNRRRVVDLGWFKDTSSLLILGQPLSLNVRAVNGV